MNYRTSLCGKPASRTNVRVLSNADKGYRTPVARANSVGRGLRLRPWRAPRAASAAVRGGLGVVLLVPLVLDDHLDRLFPLGGAGDLGLDGALDVALALAAAARPALVLLGLDRRQRDVHAAAVAALAGLGERLQQIGRASCRERG